MRLLFILLLLLMSCNRKEVKIEGIIGETKTKYCMQACIRKHFEMFHNEGSSWGTGSSSMNGLSQERIFDRVEQQCHKMMKGEKCCKRKYMEGEPIEVDNLEHSFGYYGICNQDYYYYK